MEIREVFLMIGDWQRIKNLEKRNIWKNSFKHFVGE
jgi:hypothetical protein